MDTQTRADMSAVWDVRKEVGYVLILLFGQTILLFMVNVATSAVRRCKIPNLSTKRPCKKMVPSTALHLSLGRANHDPPPPPRMVPLVRPAVSVRVYVGTYL